MACSKVWVDNNNNEQRPWLYFKIEIVANYMVKSNIKNIELNANRVLDGHIIQFYVEMRSCRLHHFNTMADNTEQINCDKNGKNGK